MSLYAPAAVEMSMAAQVFTTPVCASPQQGCPAGIQLSAAQVFAIAEQLAKDGKADEAIRVLKVITQDKNPDYRAEARVRIARLLVQKGDLYDAAQWYRRLLDEKPDSASVRIELAQVLARIGDEQAAAGQLRRAQATHGMPEAVARALRRSLDYFHSQTPLSLDVSFGFAPDTNINAATSADTVSIWGLPFTLNKAGRSTSGIGATYSAQVTVRQKMAYGARWITQLGSSGTLYRQNQYDDVSLYASTGPEIIDSIGSIHPAVTVGHRFYGASSLYNFYGGSVTTLLRQGLKGQITLSGSMLQFNYARSRDYQSGITKTVAPGYDRALSPEIVAHAGVSASRADAADPAYALKGASGEVVVSRDFKPFTVFGRASFSRAWGDAAYPLFGLARDDTTYEGDVGIIFRRVSFHGLSPQIKAIYLRSDSPIALFQYRRLRGEFSLTGSF